MQYQETLLFPQHNLIRQRSARKKERQLDAFIYVRLEQRVPQDHPLRPLRAMTDEALITRTATTAQQAVRQDWTPFDCAGGVVAGAPAAGAVFGAQRAAVDGTARLQPAVPLVRGFERDDPIWDVNVFTKNRERLLDGDIAGAFFQAVLQQARGRSLLSNEHFTVEGTLLEAWANVKSYQRKDAKATVPPDDPGNATVNFHGEKRSNQTHASKTDPAIEESIRLDGKSPLPRLTIT
jgi:hypothetical protein